MVKFTVDDWRKALECAKEFSFCDGKPEQTLYRVLCSPDLIELREVANAIKHGPGRALEALHKMGAVVVDKSRIEKDVFSGEFSELRFQFQSNQMTLLGIPMQFSNFGRSEVDLNYQIP